MNIFNRIEQKVNDYIENIVECEVDNPILPDGSSFFTSSWPLPKNHWLFKPRDYENEKALLEALPFLRRNDDRRRIVEAAKLAIRHATDYGKDKDFDPDALIQNLILALCGPSNSCEESSK